mmetsp:Transcript_18195/g.27445  ORF Transcript_18195/g.27445 Transcript_18195/m.27445 type:complete len:302 (+) Transcript_18195:1-906(+)
MSRRPYKGFGLVGHLLASGVCFVLLVEDIGWNCQALGEKICPLANQVKPHEPVRKAMLSIGLNDRWKMFSPNVSHREFWIDVLGAVDIKGKVHRVPLWKNGGPLFSGELQGLWEKESEWPRPAVHSPPFEAHRWLKLFEGKNWDNHKVDWGRFLCRQWKKSRGHQRLVGLWTIKTTRPIEVEVTYGALRYELLSMSWCDKGGEAIMKNLTKPSWLTKGVYGKAISWKERRSGNPGAMPLLEEPETVERPSLFPIRLFLLLLMAALFWWLERWRRSVGQMPKGLVVHNHLDRPGRQRKVSAV